MYFLPPRLLPATTVSIVPYANWEGGSMGSGDPWVGYPYQWTVTFNVVAQSQSSHLTPTPFYYTGNDVVVGDWYADLAQGLSVKIISIVSQNFAQVVAVCEDVDRFNTFTDLTGNGTGIGGTGNGFIFTLNDESLPILIPMSGLSTSLALNVAWQQDQIGRFQYRNYLKTFYRVDQPGHTFSVGDVLCLAPIANVVGNSVTYTSQYEKVTANTAAVTAVVGQVNSVGAPGPDWFTYLPNGRIVTDLSVPLPGVPGDLIYLSSSGLSNIAPTIWASPIYIQLEDNTTGIALNRGVDTAGSLGYTTKTYVVPNSNAANAVVLNLGDQVMVDNSGFGEWTHYLSHYGSLRQISTQDSSHVDAESLEVVVNNSTVLSNVVVNGVTMNGVLLGNISANRSITTVNVTVNSQYDPNSVITVGTVSNSINDAIDSIMPNALIDLTMVGSYAYTPTVVFNAPYTSVYAFVNLNQSNDIGNATITVSYV